jgi:outer membrane protein
MKRDLFVFCKPIIGLCSILISMSGCNRPSQSYTPRIEDYLPLNLALVKAEATKKAEATDKDAPLTLDACVRIALAENPLIVSANEGINIAHETVGEVRALYYPQITTSINYRRWETHAFLPSGIPAIASNVIGPTDDWTASAKAHYTIFDSGERRAQLLAAKATLKAAGMDFSGIQQDIALNVHIAFYYYLSADESLSVAEKNLKRADEHLRLAKKRFEAGATLEADVLRAQVSVAENKLTLVKAQSLVKLSKGALNTSMGLPVELEISIAQNLQITLPLEEDNLQNAFDKAVHSRPEISAALERIASAQQKLNSIKGEYGPRLTTDVSYGRRDTDFFPEDKDYSAGLSIEIPVFSGFLKNHRAAKAESEILIEEAEIKRRIQKVREEVWISYHRLKETQEAVNVSGILVKDAEESLRLTQKRYETGAGTITDLLDSQTKLAQAESSRVESQLAFYTTSSMYKKALGTLLLTGTDP